MSKTWFTSDFHMDHRNILEYCNRPYLTVGEMNEAIVANWNAVVEQDDTVYFLGDFSLSIKSVQKYLPRLMGNKVLITGNHDLVHPCFKKKADKYIDYK